MKKGLFISLFISVHIGFIFLQIHKQMVFIKESYNKQKHEQHVAHLNHKKQLLINQLHQLQNKKDIKEFAHQDLDFEPIHISQIKCITP